MKDRLDWVIEKACQIGVIYILVAIYNEVVCNVLRYYGIYDRGILDYIAILVMVAIAKKIAPYGNCFVNSVIEFFFKKNQAKWAL